MKRHDERRGDTIITMENSQTESPEPDDEESRVKTLTTSIAERAPGGSLLAVLGAALLARAIWSQRRVRALVHAIAGAGLVGFGLWKRRSTEESGATDGAEDVEIAGTGTAEERADSHQIDVNPRETEEVDDQTESGERSIEFTDDQEERPQTEPTLDDSASKDPRLDEEEETTTVDISEAAMADEPNEAVGPTPEQSQPSQTDPTAPEATSPEEESDAADEGGQPNNEEGENEKSTGEDESEKSASEDEPTDDGEDQAGDDDKEN